MNRLTRRKFLAEALASGAGVALVRPFVASELGPLVEPAGADELPAIDSGFVAGRVVDVNQRAGEATVQDLDGQLRRLLYGGSSSTWREGAWNHSRVQVGDCVYVRGTPDEAGWLQVDRSWSNIDSFSAQVRAAGAQDLTLELSDANEVAVRVAAQTAVQAADGLFVSGVPAVLSPGDQVHVIAYHVANSPFPIASTVFRTSAGSIAADTPEGDLTFEDEDLPELEVVGTESCMVYKGLTTWFCCGNVSGCGRCSGSSGGGACGNCRSDQNHMAWPKLATGCGPFCSDCCISASFPRLACGFSLSVRNPCNGNRANVRIQDCGPTVRCSTPSGCKNYRKIKFDLTPCAFSAIGNLDSGIIRCHARVNCGTSVGGVGVSGVPVPCLPRTPCAREVSELPGPEID